MDSIGKGALTAITPIIPEKLEMLKQALQGIQKVPDANIGKIGTIHFARGYHRQRHAPRCFHEQFRWQLEVY